MTDNVYSIDTGEPLRDADVSPEPHVIRVRIELPEPEPVPLITPLGIVFAVLAGLVSYAAVSSML
ncbi:hypothetical protein PH7735_01786 [Shimia thalassica]|uniref:Uncharacterized protein n=1 Tax=Shimia thalassica TaxID=1715693 RepID=A0A0N7M951_9RHOB|nr:hypothetical protein [Shimia thalassica]CUJ94773.1 hypothetical protein PH7735_01786 [Shimia thalassica]